MQFSTVLARGLLRERASGARDAQRVHCPAAVRSVHCLRVLDRLGCGQYHCCGGPWSVCEACTDRDRGEGVKSPANDLRSESTCWHSVGAEILSGGQICTTKKFEDDGGWASVCNTLRFLL